MSIPWPAIPPTSPALVPPSLLPIELFPGAEAVCTFHCEYTSLPVVHVAGKPSAIIRKPACQPETLLGHIESNWTRPTHCYRVSWIRWQVTRWGTLLEHLIVPYESVWKEYFQLISQDHLYVSMFCCRCSEGPKIYPGIISQDQDGGLWGSRMLSWCMYRRKQKHLHTPARLIFLKCISFWLIH